MDSLQGNQDTTSKRIVLDNLEKFLDMAKSIIDAKARNELEEKIGQLIKETNHDIASMEHVKP